MLIMTDVVMFFIRLIIFFGAIFIMVGLVNDVMLTINSNEQSRALFQLAENYLESELTSARGVFDANAVIARNGNPEEIARLCAYPSGAEFYAWKGSKLERISAFGYTDASEGMSKEFPVWLKFGQQAVPGIMKIKLWHKTYIETVGTPAEWPAHYAVYMELPALSCALERAWAYKVAQPAVEFTCPWSPCVIYTEADMLCVAEGMRSTNARCRHMPGVSVQAQGGGDVVLGSGEHKLRAVPVVKGGASSCDAPALVLGEVESVLLCEVEQ